MVENEDGHRTALYPKFQELSKWLTDNNTVRMLDALCTKGPKRFTDLLVYLDKSTLDRRLKVLLALKIVNKKPVEANRSFDVYSITALGRKPIAFMKELEKVLGDLPHQKKMEDFEDVEVKYEDLTK